MLAIRGCGPIGYPGSGEVVNMQPPDYLLKEGIRTLPTMGDGRQSGTSASPSILNIAPESAAGGNLALLETGDEVRVDLNECRWTCWFRTRNWSGAERISAAGDSTPDPMAGDLPGCVGQLDTGGCLELATRYQNVGQDHPRHYH